MPRIKLTPLDNYVFSIILPVRITDINAGAHLGNDSFVSLLHEARFRYVQSLDFKDEMDAGVIMQDLIVNFRAESFYNDILTIHIGVAEKRKFSLRMYYKVVDENNKLIALAETGLAFIDYKTRKLVLAPDAFS